jgi:hypothetical protein
MVGDRSRYGLCVSAVGAVILATSLFMPWYAPGHSQHAGLAAPAVHRLALVDAYHALPAFTVVLLVLGALALLDVLAPLAHARGPVPGAAGGSVVLLGCVAAVCVLYRMIDPPGFGAGTIVLSLREGAWLALIGSITMAIGGIWPRCAIARELGTMQPGTLSWN